MSHTHNDSNRLNNLGPNFDKDLLNIPKNPLLSDI